MARKRISMNGTIPVEEPLHREQVQRVTENIRRKLLMQRLCRLKMKALEKLKCQNTGYIDSIPKCRFFPSILLKN